MSVQRNINQLIAQAGVLAHLNPELQAKAEKRGQLRELSKQEKGLTKTHEALMKSAEPTFKKVVEGTATEEEKKGLQFDYKKAENLREQKLDLLKEKLEVDPTEANYQALRNTTLKYQESEKSQKEIFKKLSPEAQKRAVELFGYPKGITPEEVNNEMATKGAEKIKQKIKFADHIKVIKKEDM